MLGAPAVIISRGRASAGPSTRSCSTTPCSRAAASRSLGAVINKVDADAHPSLPDVAARAASRATASALLGTLPYRPILSNPTLSMLVEQMPGELLHPGGDLDRQIEHVAIGAMQPRHVFERIGPGSLLIVPGDREDVIHAAIAAQRHLAIDPARDGGLSALREEIAGRAVDRTRTARRSGWSSRAATEPAAREPGGHPPGGHVRLPGAPGHVCRRVRIHDLLVKTHPADPDKIAEIKALVARDFDVDGLLRHIDERAH